MSKKSEILCVSKARVTSIEFTLEGDKPATGTEGKRTSFSVSPQDEAEIMQLALEAYKTKRPVEVYEDRHGKIVKIQPTDAI